MKKLILVAIMLLSITTVVEAQSIRFGVKGGINYANQNGTEITVNSDTMTLKPSQVIMQV